MSDMTDQAYEAARYATAKKARTSVGQLVGTIDYLNQEGLGSSFSLSDYLSAHSDRLYYKTALADRAVTHGVAYIEHYMWLSKRIVPIFENVATSVEAAGSPDPYLEGIIQKIRVKLQEDYQILASFLTTYQTEIAAEKVTSEYNLDQKIIRSVVDEMARVSTFGQWTPEFIMVNDHVTGKPVSAELPSSIKMGKLARLAPQLRRIGLGDSG